MNKARAKSKPLGFSPPDLILSRYKTEYRALADVSDIVEMFACEVLTRECWKDLSDDDLVELIELLMDGDPTPIRDMAGIVRSEVFGDSADNPKSDVGKQQALLESGLQFLAVRECGHRIEAQTLSSQVLFRFLVYKHPKSLADFLGVATKHLTWHPEMDARAAQEEIASIASLELSKKLSSFQQAENPLSMRLTAAFNGRLHRIADNVRTATRDHLEGRVRRAHLNDALRMDHEDKPIEMPGPATVNSSFSLEYVMQEFGLTAEDKVLIEMRCEDCTQEQIAAALNKTQPAVSQQLSKIRQKLSPLRSQPVRK
jgi:hypothetical protein